MPSDAFSHEFHALSRVVTHFLPSHSVSFLTCWSRRGVFSNVLVLEGRVGMGLEPIFQSDAFSHEFHALSRVVCPHVACLSSRSGPGGACFLTFWSWRGVSEWVWSRFSSFEQLLRRTHKIISSAAEDPNSNWRNQCKRITDSDSLIRRF